MVQRTSANCKKNLHNQEPTIILPAKGDEIDSLVRYEHARNGHAGVNYSYAPDDG